MVPVEIDNTKLVLVQGSVAEQEVDAVVNAANKMMRGGGGVDGVIHRLAGRGLLRELEQLAPSGARTSQVIVTHGHNLPHAYVFHVAGPRWGGGRQSEPEQLAACYRNSLVEADARDLTSIAFCSISTGIYGFPIELAAPIAVQTVALYIHENEATKLTRVVFAMYQDLEYHFFEEALKELSGRPGDSLDENI